MILEGLMEKKDLKAYIAFRIQHLVLERQKVPFLDIPDKKKQGTIKQLDGRIKEIKYMLKNINCLKQQSKYFYSKVKHLEKMKVMHIKEANESNNSEATLKN